MSDRPVDPETIENARRKIQIIAQQIADLSKQELSAEDFFREFLERLLTAMAAVGGAVWVRSSAGVLQLLYQVNFRTTELTEGGDDQTRHERLLGKIVSTGEATVVPPYSGSGEQQEAGNPTPYLLLLIPLVVEGTVEGIVEIFQRPGGVIDVQRGYLTFLSQMSEHAAGWMKSRRLRQVSEQQSLWQQLNVYSQAVHETLDRHETAYVIANESQRLLNCDRVSVAVRHGRDYFLAAISGQDTFDKRSSMVGLLQTLVRRVLASGDGLRYVGSTEDLPPQIVSALEEYVDHAHSKSILVLPLRRPRPSLPTPTDAVLDESEQPGELVGALVCEQLEDKTPSQKLADRAALIAPHAARALTNCDDYHSLFLMPVWRALGRSRVLVTGRNLPKTIAVAATALVLLLVALVVRIDFAPEGKGELQPIEQRNIFAGVDGVVTKVHVEHGDAVKKGQPLVTLRNTDLSVQLQDVAGQRQSTLERLLDLQRQLLENSAMTPSERNRMAGELMQVRRQKESLDIQCNLLQRKQQELVVTSPIDGEVITWDTQKLLINRPVAPGQVLLTIAKPGGGWELLVHMPEDNMGYIQRWQEKNKEPLRASFVLATDPSRRLVGNVQRIHQLSELHESEGQTVTIAVGMDQRQLVEPRPGATATAQIHCGKRSVAFVWLHDVWEFLQTRVFF